MPRKPRFFIPEALVHAIQRRHNRSAVFFDDLDYLDTYVVSNRPLIVVVARFIPMC